MRPWGAGRPRPAATRLKLTADGIVPIYEADLLQLDLASKGDVTEESEDNGYAVRNTENL